MSQVKRLLGYVSSVVVSISYCGSVTTAQLLGQYLPRFQLNSIRLTSQLLLATSLILLFKKNVLAVKSCRHAALIVFCGVLYCLTILTMNWAAIFVPVGNMESLLIMTCIVASLFCAWLTERVAVVDIVGGVTSCVGVLLLLQPSLLFGGNSTEMPEVDPCPCFGGSHHRSDRCLLRTLNLEVAHNISLTNTSTQSAEEDGFKNKIWTPFEISEATFGYILSLVTGVEYVVYLELSKAHLLPQYHFSVVSFWSIGIACVMSVLAMLALETPTAIGWHSCGWTVAAHSLAGSSVLILSHVVLVLTSVAELAVLSTLGIVLLFIVQVTWLADVRESKGNVFEIVGAILVVVACLLAPLWTLFKEVTSRVEKESKHDMGEEEMWDSEKTVLVTNDKARKYTGVD